jgi:hypothetical protein
MAPESSRLGLGTPGFLTWTMFYIPDPLGRAARHRRRGGEGYGVVVRGRGATGRACATGDIGDTLDRGHGLHILSPNSLEFMEMFIS